jgi:hypothetical protein
MTMLDYLTAAKKAIAAITNTKAVKAQRTEAFIEAYSLIIVKGHTSFQPLPHTKDTITLALSSTFSCRSLEVVKCDICTIFFVPYVYI